MNNFWRQHRQNCRVYPSILCRDRRVPARQDFYAHFRAALL